jgi:hypothetical protein
MKEGEGGEVETVAIPQLQEFMEASGNILGLSAGPPVLNSALIAGWLGFWLCSYLFWTLQ